MKFVFHLLFKLTAKKIKFPLLGISARFVGMKRSGIRAICISQSPLSHGATNEKKVFLLQRHATPSCIHHASLHLNSTNVSARSTGTGFFKLLRGESRLLRLLRRGRGVHDHEEVARIPPSFKCNAWQKRDRAPPLTRMFARSVARNDYRASLITIGGGVEITERRTSDVGVIKRVGRWRRLITLAAFALFFPTSILILMLVFQSRLLYPYNDSSSVNFPEPRTTQISWSQLG